MRQYINIKEFMFLGDAKVPELSGLYINANICNV